MVEHTATVIESQVDYLTCSSHSEDNARRLQDLAERLTFDAERQGNKRTGWRSMGYIGYHVGHFDWGRGDERQAILRMGGQAAEDNLIKALSIADYVSRLDVAVTWRAVPADPHLGDNAYSVAELAYHSGKRVPRPERKQDADGGCTVQIGDRRSPYYGRLYNKEAERASRADEEMAAHYAGCWRYEVEAHDLRAVALGEATSLAEDRAGFVQSFVHRWFAERGVTPMFPPTGQVAILPGFHRRTDDESSLRHLKRNVRPTLKRLASHGRLGEAREALGLESSNLLLSELERLLAL